MHIVSIFNNICVHYRLVLKDENKVSDIRAKVKSTVPGSEQARLFGKELSFVLPRDKVTVFPQLFQSVRFVFRFSRLTDTIPGGE